MRRMPLGINSFLICTVCLLLIKVKMKTAEYLSKSNDDGDEMMRHDEEATGQGELSQAVPFGKRRGRFYIGGTIYTDAKGTNALSGAKIR